MSSGFVATRVRDPHLDKILACTTIKQRICNGEHVQLRRIALQLIPTYLHTFDEHDGIFWQV